MMSSSLHVASLHIHPVKSCGAISVQRARVFPRGFEHDRNFMIVREDARGTTFVTQREHPVLARVATSIQLGATPEAHILSLRTHDAHVEIPLDPATASEGRERSTVRVWKDDVEAAVLGGDAAAFFSALLGFDVRLVAMPPDVRRPVDGTYAKAGDHVSFADGFPVLLASEASREDVNARIADAGGAPVPMSRFRPNLVVSGGEPFAEERASRVRVGKVVFRMPKRCARCQVTTVDQETGVSRGKEPLRTLAAHRRDGQNVFFGQNLVAEDLDADAEIAVGDEVEYLA